MLAKLFFKCLVVSVFSCQLWANMVKVEGISPPHLFRCSSRWHPFCLNVHLCKGFTDGPFCFLQNKETYEPLCKVPLMTSSKEEQKLIATSNKVSNVVSLWHMLQNLWLSTSRILSIFFKSKYKLCFPHSQLSNCCTIGATINIHIPGKFSVPFSLSKDVITKESLLFHESLYLLPQQLGWQHAEKYWAVWQAVITVQWSSAIHQGRYRGWNLLLVILWPGS